MRKTHTSSLCPCGVEIGGKGGAEKKIRPFKRSCLGLTALRVDCLLCSVHGEKKTRGDLTALGF